MAMPCTTVMSSVMSSEYMYVDLDAVDHYMGPQYYYEVDTYSV